MKKQIVQIFALAVALLLGLMLVVAYSQEPESEQFVEGISAQGEIGISGLADDPPAGKKILYMFTGVHHRNASPAVVTTVHCTNYGTAVEFRVEIFDHDVSNNYIPLFTTIPSNHTVTISTSDFSPTVDIEYGSGRVLADDSPDTEIICTAQVIDPASPPSFSSALDMFQP
jgi:hypothetical protein